MKSVLCETWGTLCFLYFEGFEGFVVVRSPQNAINYQKKWRLSSVSSVLARWRAWLKHELVDTIASASMLHTALRTLCDCHCDTHLGAPCVFLFKLVTQ